MCAYTHNVANTVTRMSTPFFLTQQAINIVKYEITVSFMHAMLCLNKFCYPIKINKSDIVTI